MFPPPLVVHCSELHVAFADNAPRCSSIFRPVLDRGVAQGIDYRAVDSLRSYLRPHGGRSSRRTGCSHQSQPRVVAGATDFVPAQGNGGAAGVEVFLQSLRVHGLPCREAPPPAHPVLLHNHSHRKIAVATASGPLPPQRLLLPRNLRSRLYPRHPPQKGQLSLSRSLLHLY
jgi:hypothetical protein